MQTRLSPVNCKIRISQINWLTVIHLLITVHLSAISKPLPLHLGQHSPGNCSVIVQVREGQGPELWHLTLPRSQVHCWHLSPGAWNRRPSLINRPLNRQSAIRYTNSKITSPNNHFKNWKIFVPTKSSFSTLLWRRFEEDSVFMFTSTVGAAVPLWNHSMCTPVHTGFVGFTGNNALGALAHLAGVPGGRPGIPIVVLPPSIYTACQTFNPELNIHSYQFRYCTAMFL